MDKFTLTPFKIRTDEQFYKFLEENKHKIPEDVRVERVSKNFADDHTGVIIHAYTLSLGLYLPFHPLIREILSRLHLAPIQLGPNCWRIMFGILALNRICNIKLGWHEFCYCYVAKQNSGVASLYYFSPRNKRSSLVTNLPGSEKGDWKEELIYLKGNWERRTGDASDVHVVPRTKADGRPIGAVKHQDCQVNGEDLQKALSYENRDWRYLLDPDNWGTVAVEEAVSKKKQSRGKQLIQDCGAAHSGGLIKERTTRINVQSIQLIKKQKLNINHSHSTTGSVNNHGLQGEGSTQDVVRTRSRFLHSAQEATAAATQAFHSRQNLPNSHASMPIAHSPPRHCLGNNNPKAGTGIDFNFNWMELLHSLFLGNDIDHHQGSEKHLSDPFLKDIQHLEHKPFEEVCSEVARSVGRVGTLIVFLMNRIKCQNATIKDLQATIERLNKGLDESQLAVGKEAVRFENSRATEEESLLDVKKELQNMEKSFQSQIERLNKNNAEIRGELTQFREMNSRQQNQPHFPQFWPMSAASEKDMTDWFAMYENSVGNPNQISKNGIQIGCPSRVNTNTNLPGDDGLGLTAEASLVSRKSGHDKRTKLQ